jgi:Leucine-rich repeat (LRR) protein
MRRWFVLSLVGGIATWSRLPEGLPPPALLAQIAAEARAVPIQVVYDDTGEPAEGVHILARYPASPSNPRDAVAAQASDEDGRVTLRLPPGDYPVRLLPAFRTPYIETDGTIGIADMARNPPIVVRLRRGTVLEVTVLDTQTGKGVPNATLLQQTFNVGPMDRVAMGISRYALEYWRVEYGDSLTQRPRTGRDGVLRTIIEPGRHLLDVAQEETPWRAETGFQVVDCEAGKPTRITFRIKGHGGGAVPGAANPRAALEAALKAIGARTTFDDDGQVDLIYLYQHRANDDCLEQLAELAAPRRLSIQGNIESDVTERGVAAIGCLSSLKELEVYRVPLREPSLAPLADLQQLESLTLHGCRLGDDSLRPIGALKGLRVLNVAGNHITDAGLAHIAAVEALEELNVRGEPGRNNLMRITDAGLATLAPLQNLRVLKIAGDRVSDAGLADVAYLSRLEELDLSNNSGDEAGVRVSDAGLAALARLPNLRRLTLASYNTWPPLTPAADAAIPAFANLESLKLVGNQFTDAALRLVGDCRGLKSLSVSTGQMTDAAFAEIRRLKRLEELRLESPTLTGRIVADVAELPNLKQLSLRIAGLTDDVLSQLAAIRTLEHLELYGSELTAAGLAHLRDLPLLKSLVLNELAGTQLLQATERKPRSAAEEARSARLFKP